MSRPKNSQSRTRGTGITTRPLGDEERRQGFVPPRGSRRRRPGGPVEPFAEPTRARRRGRALEMELDVLASAAAVQPPVAKPNRRLAVDAPGDRVI